MNPKNNDGKINASKQAPLSEKDFIQNRWPLPSLPLWVWLFLIVSLILVLIGTKGWYEGLITKEKKHDPFLEVTNREFSVFLWQFPAFLRNNVSQKAGYLPGFLSSQENLDPNKAEEYVSAPPDLIFLYHTWRRLLASELIVRPISVKEFNEFLKQLPEWQPENWTNAPKEYVQWIESKQKSNEDLQTLPESTLPLIVRQAFQGWKNYFKEGAQINELKPTFAQIKSFLEKYPHYARNYWRNIGEIHHQMIAGELYLQGTLNKNFSSDKIVPSDQLAPFLKVALYNAEQAQAIKQ